MRNLSILILLSVFSSMSMFALEGKFNFQLTDQNSYFAIPNRGYYNQTEFKIKVACTPGTSVRIGWLLRYSECINEFYLNSNRLPDGIYEEIYKQPNIVLLNYPYVQYLKPNMKTYTCDPNSEIIDLFVSSFLVTELAWENDIILKHLKLNF